MGSISYYHRACGVIVRQFSINEDVEQANPALDRDDKALLDELKKPMQLDNELPDGFDHTMGELDPEPEPEPRPGTWQTVPDYVAKFRKSIDGLAMDAGITPSDAMPKALEVLGVTHINQIEGKASDAIAKVKAAWLSAQKPSTPEPLKIEIETPSAPPQSKPQIAPKSTPMPTVHPIASPPQPMQLAPVC